MTVLEYLDWKQKETSKQSLMSFKTEYVFNRDENRCYDDNSQEELTIDR